jgi:hypothetical protein
LLILELVHIYTSEFHRGFDTQVLGIRIPWTAVIQELVDPGLRFRLGSYVLFGGGATNSKYLATSVVLGNWHSPRNELGVHESISGAFVSFFLSPLPSGKTFRDKVDKLLTVMFF